MSGMAEGTDNFTLSARAAGEFLAHDAGPRIAVMQIDGWDTHVNQAGRLTNQFARLSEGLLALRQSLGAAWGQSVVLVASEFGRTVAENGAGGTDHGTGGLAMLLGGAVRGGRILGDWPGLSDRALYEGRDLAAVNACEALFKSVLIGHMGLSPELAESVVFPGSAGIRPMEGLLRV